MKKKRMITDVNDELQALVDKLYTEAPKRIHPMFPYVLVRELPRHRQAGRIFMPGDSNKVLHEGIVLDVFTSFWKAVDKKKIGDPEIEGMFVFVESPVRKGDHVLYQMYEGIPIEHVLFNSPYFKSRDYVLVSADPVGGGRNGIVGVVEGCEDTKKALIEALIPSGECPWFLMNLGEDEVGAIADMLLDRFIITHEDQNSATFSGAGGHKS